MAAFSGSTTSGSLTGALRSTTGGTIEQSDGTAWIDMYRVRMLAIALWLACHDRGPYESVGSKFFEHFVYIAPRGEASPAEPE